jgi:uncharacterized membrane protein YfcA
MPDAAAQVTPAACGIGASLMLEFLSGAFAGITSAELALIAGLAFVASVIGGVSGYGTGALMPLVLVPIVGPEPVVPMLSLSALLNNASRMTAYRHLVDYRRVLVVLPAAAPTTLLGAWGYTQLSGRGAALVIGTMMMLSVPLRRVLKRRGFGLSDRGLGLAAAGWGAVAGGTTGAGVILLSLLMAVGLQGAAVVATDAVISIGIGVAKISVFGVAGVLGARELAMALLMGAVALPGAFLARAMVERMPLAVHAAILDAVVIAGGAVMIYGALLR